MRRKTRLVRIEKLLRALEPVDQRLYVCLTVEEFEQYEAGEIPEPLEGIDYPVKLYIGFDLDAAWDDESESDDEK